MVVLSGGQYVTSTSPVDYGERTPILGPRATLGPSGGLPLLEASATYSQIYRAQQWVATLVNKVGYAQARLPLKGYRRVRDGREELPRERGLGRLLQQPAPGQDPFFHELWTGSTFEINGEAIWIKLRDADGLPVGLWPMHPANLDVRRAGTSVEYVWKLRRDAGPEIFWPAEDVVHFKSFNPDTTLRGMSRLEPLRRTILAEQATQTAQEAFWRRGARPGVVLKHPKSLRPETAERLRAQWETLQSGTENWGRTAVLEEGMEAQIVQLSGKEMQMIEQRKLSREEACSMFDVPPPVVHILDRATFSNITEQMRSMYRDTMAPRLGLYESVLNESLAPEFGDREYVRYNLNEVLRGAPEQRYASYATAINYGFMKPGEARALEELPDAGEDSQQLYISSAMVPLKAAADAQAPTRGSTASTASTTRSVLGRLGRVTDPTEVVATTVTAGLPQDLADSVFAAIVKAQRGGADMHELRAEVRAALTSEEEQS